MQCAFDAKDCYDPSLGLGRAAGDETRKRAAAPRATHAPQAQIDQSAVVQLRVLATTDLHGDLLSYDYYTNRPNPGRGLAQIAALIAEARREVPGSVLLDNGDFMQGSAVVERAGHRKKGPHPAITAFNALGYDAVGLGNHEFNYGLERLQEALRHAAFPVLASNVTLAPIAGQPARAHLAAPYTMIERVLSDGAGRAAKVKIGVFSLVPPEIMLWDRHHLEGRIDVQPMRDCAREMVPNLKALGADLVICLAHTGVFVARGANEDQALAADIAEIDGLDAIVAGHSHLEFPFTPTGEHTAAVILGQAQNDPRIRREEGYLAGKPCVQPGSFGSHLGVIDLWLVPEGAGWRVARSKARLRAAQLSQARPRGGERRRAALVLRAAVGADHRATLAWLRRPLAETRVPLTTHFALVQDCQAMRVVAAALGDHARSALDGSGMDDLPLVCAVTPFRTGGWGGPQNITDIPAGRLSLRHIYDLYPYPNRMVVKRVKVSNLYARLERATAVFRQLQPGLADQALLDPAVPGFSYKIMAGLGYEIDLSRPHISGLSPAERRQVLAGKRPGRIGDLTYEGRALARDEEVILVTNSFTNTVAAAEGDEVVLFEDRRLCADLIAAWAVQNRSIARLPALRWRLRVPKEASVVVPFGPGAVPYLHEIAYLRPKAIGQTPEGFEHYRLHL